jgi:uncharacterized protein YaiE (UPF0345 family)
MERLIGLIAVVMLVAAGATAVDDATRRSSPQVTVDNESFDAVGGSVVELNNSNRDAVYFEDAVDVYTFDSQGNKEIDDGVLADGNYTWNTNNGTLTVVDNSYLDNQTNTSVTYNYSRPDKTQRGIAQIIGNGLDVAQLLILVLGAGLVLASVRVLGGL